MNGNFNALPVMSNVRIVPVMSIMRSELDGFDVLYVPEKSLR